ncbi:tyrosine-type recombinase/integrase [Streptomyces tirandamycinicus]|uniref:tyrosine-type recombinase/integrase n=1 Tax=Streptomyces tirandamycinicus TaxID=2174846 RepID=UPI00142E1C7F|nr:tyrosine-type recombinase/integrase [Streptomyces tirandamycinicus]
MYEAEVVDDGAGPAVEPVRYLVNQHTMLGPGEMPPRADARPAWTDDDFRISAEDKAELDEPDLAENTIINRDSTVRAFEEWCAEQKPPRLAWPCTTATYTSYGLHLIRRGKSGEFVPDTVGQYMSRIWNWQPEDWRPDPSRVRGKLRLWRKDWKAAGGEVQRSAALTIPYLMRCLQQCDETTSIGIRDAFMLALAYGNLHRRIELADLLVQNVRITASGLIVTTATSKTDKQSKGATEFIQDREDLRLVSRARAWLSVLRELGADGPTQPLFRALTVKGNLANRTLATKRGDRMKGGALNERIQHLADLAGIPYIANKKVTAHSLRAGANTDMVAAGVPLRERNRRGRWSAESHTADTVYDRPETEGQEDPLNQVPLGGFPRSEGTAAE